MKKSQELHKFIISLISKRIVKLNIEIFSSIIKATLLFGYMMIIVFSSPMLLVILLKNHLPWLGAILSLPIIFINGKIIFKDTVISKKLDTVLSEIEELYSFLNEASTFKSLMKKYPKKTLQINEYLILRKKLNDLNVNIKELNVKTEYQSIFSDHDNKQNSNESED